MAEKEADIVSTGNNDSRVPERRGMDDPDIKWRYGGPPDYTTPNSTYLRQKRFKHEKDSLEWVVESLVKTFEMEAAHKVDLKDWVSVDTENFKISNNGGRVHTAEDIIKRGTYNIFLEDCPIYSQTDRCTSDKMFRDAFVGGFVWEVKEALQGPKNVSFIWRHWGKYGQPYEGHEPTNECLEMGGTGIVTLTEDVKLRSAEFHYDPNPLLMKLMHVKPASLHKYCTSHPSAGSQS